MKRGTLSFTNPELSALYNLVLAQEYEKSDLIQKLTPTTGSIHSSQEIRVQISEDEAEILLDCMPAPSNNSDVYLESSRIKIQQFIARRRFPESSEPNQP